MYCVKRINDDLFWVGGTDRRLALFENAYPIPRGVSYNAYLLLDEKTVLFDTVDRAITEQFFENIDALLKGRALDYVVVNHMEPDHCATLGEIVLRYPGVQVVCATPKPFRLSNSSIILTLIPEPLWSRKMILFARGGIHLPSSWRPWYTGRRLW